MRESENRDPASLSCELWLFWLWFSMWELFLYRGSETLLDVCSREMCGPRHGRPNNVTANSHRLR